MESFSLEIPLIAPVIASATLYCIDTIQRIHYKFGLNSIPYVCIFEKKSSQKSDQVPKISYKIVVRKFSICSLKEKNNKKLKINYITLLES